MKRRIVALIFAVLTAVVLTLPVFANAEAGPDFTVLTDDAPDDMTVTLVTPDGITVPLNPLRRGWESCFRLYYNDLYDAIGNGYAYRPDAMEEIAESSVLHVVSDTEKLDLTVPMPPADEMHYNHLAVLRIDRDGSTAWLSAGTYMNARNTLLVVLRVTVTLITEGIVFAVMGYRTKKSWVVFLITNLVTQTLLNLSLTGNYLAMGYWELGFHAAEVLIFIAEAAVFACLLREQSRAKGIVTALLANAASLALGWALLTYLPM